ncbi:TetR/AcrR family transcriptional regulator [Rhodanobacter koreensis]
MTSKPQRRTQAERSAATRAEILKATVHSLFTHGYAATTTLLVAKEAKVSRGAMLHHFPTKVDLMLFVVQAVYDEEIELYRTRLAEIGDPLQRRSMFPRIVWDVLSRPPGVAVLEILQGSRSDSVLAKKLAPLQAKIERDSIDRIEELVPGSGAKPSLAMVRLVVWAIRGLSIANVLVHKPTEIVQSVELLRELLHAYSATANAVPAQPKKVVEKVASRPPSARKGGH